MRKKTTPALATALILTAALLLTATGTPEVAATNWDLERHERNVNRALGNFVNPFEVRKERLKRHTPTQVNENVAVPPDIVKLLTGSTDTPVNTNPTRWRMRREEPASEGTVTNVRVCDRNEDNCITPEPYNAERHGVITEEGKRQFREWNHPVSQQQINQQIIQLIQDIMQTMVKLEQRIMALEQQ